MNKFQSIENNKKNYKNNLDYNKDRRVSPGINAIQDQQTKNVKTFKALLEYRKNFTFENGDLKWVLKIK